MARRCSSDLVALTPAHLKTIIGRRDCVDRGMRRIIADGIATGAFGDRDAKLLSFAILGAVNWIPALVQAGRTRELGTRSPTASRAI